jgi:RNA polymerase sigma-70 factor, ECF subfamily
VGIESIDRFVASALDLTNKSRCGEKAPAGAGDAVGLRRAQLARACEYRQRQARRVAENKHPSERARRTHQTGLALDADAVLKCRMASLEDVKRALGGERVAIDELVRELSPVIQARVATALWRRGRSSRQELEDITQEVLMELFTGEARVLAHWQPERGLSLASFVGLVAQRLVFSLLRSRRRSPFTQEPTDPSSIEASAPSSRLQPTPEGPLAARELLELLFERLHADLSPKGLEMFYRLYVWQEEPEHIARETGSKLEAIYQWRSRLKKEVSELETSLLQRNPSNSNLASYRTGSLSKSNASS